MTGANKERIAGMRTFAKRDDSPKRRDSPVRQTVRGRGKNLTMPAWMKDQGGDDAPPKMPQVEKRGPDSGSSSKPRAPAAPVMPTVSTMPAAAAADPMMAQMMAGFGMANPAMAGAMMAAASMSPGSQQMQQMMAGFGMSAGLGWTKVKTNFVSMYEVFPIFFNFLLK